MDPRLEDVDKILATIDENADHLGEVMRSVDALDPYDPATLRWLAACCAARANELEAE